MAEVKNIKININGIEYEVDKLVYNGTVLAEKMLSNTLSDTFSVVKRPPFMVDISGYITVTVSGDIMTPIGKKILKAEATGLHSPKYTIKSDRVSFSGSRRVLASTNPRIIAVSVTGKVYYENNSVLNFN